MWNVDVAMESLSTHWHWRPALLLLLLFLGDDDAVWHTHQKILFIHYNSFILKMKWMKEETMKKKMEKLIIKIIVRRDWNENARIEHTMLTGYISSAHLNAHAQLSFSLNCFCFSFLFSFSTRCAFVNPGREMGYAESAWDEGQQQQQKRERERDNKWKKEKWPQWRWINGGMRGWLQAVPAVAAVAAAAPGHFFCVCSFTHFRLYLNIWTRHLVGPIRHSCLKPVFTDQIFDAEHTHTHHT